MKVRSSIAAECLESRPPILQRHPRRIAHIADRVVQQGIYALSTAGADLLKRLKPLNLWAEANAPVEAAQPVAVKTKKRPSPD
jgi:hypothetical protein